MITDGRMWHFLLKEVHLGKKQHDVGVFEPRERHYPLKQEQ